MKVVTAGEMQEIDRITIEERGMPAAVNFPNWGRSMTTASSTSSSPSNASRASTGSLPWGGSTWLTTPPLPG